MLLSFVVVEESSSRRYGFLRFTDQNDQREALIHMNGFRGLGQKPLKVLLIIYKFYFIHLYCIKLTLNLMT